MKSTYDTFMNVFENNGLGNLRNDLLVKASGRVLEIGSGTGVNISYYPSTVHEVLLTDIEKNKHLEVKLQPHMTYEEIDVMKLPYEDKSFDTVVSTLVFCSVPDVIKGLNEIKRVLKDDGTFIFIEHVLPDHEPLKSLFNVATPLWKRLASNCHLNRIFTDSLDTVEFKYHIQKTLFKTSFIGGFAKK